MKKLVYIFIFLLIISCNNRASKSMNESVLEIEASDIEIEDLEKNKIESSAIRYTNLSKEKLQEMYDLVALKQKHPEFKETIESQLKNYIDDSLITLLKTESIIENIKMKGEIIKLSDSVQKMKFYYDVIYGSSIKPDSIWAVVTTNVLVIDGETKKSNKIKFRFN